MNCYQQVINHMEIRSLWWNKIGFLSICGCVNTSIWMHYLDANKTHGEKAKWNYTRMLCAVLNKSWKWHSTKQLYGHLLPISKVRWTRHGALLKKQGWTHKLLQWTPTHGHASVGWPARTYINSMQTLLGVMDNKDEWREGVREICAVTMTWWYWNENTLGGGGLQFSFLSVYLSWKNLTTN